MYKKMGDLRQSWNRIILYIYSANQTSVYTLVMVNILLAGVAFIKDIVMARYFGTSIHADSLYLAFFLPDTVGNNLLAAVIGVTCIPVFTMASKRKIKGHFDLIVNKVVVITILLSTCLLIVLLPSVKWFFSHFSYDMFSGVQKLTVHYFFIMTPIVILSPVAIIAASLLQVKGHFTKPATMPVIINLVLLISVLVSTISEYPLLMGGYIYSSAVLISTSLVTFLSWFLVVRTKDISFNLIIHPYHLFKEKNEEIYLFFKVLLPYFCILISQQIIFIVERYWASTLEVGTISGLTYAYRISQFPIWVFIAAINTVLLPTISKLTAEGKKTKLIKELNKTFHLILGISLFISLLFYLLGDRLISFLFLKGAFDENSLSITDNIFRGYALSIVGQSIYLFCLRYFVAKGNMKTPLLTSIIGSLIHILLLSLLVLNYGAKGIGYAAAINYTLLGAILLFFLYKDVQELGKKGGQQVYE